jgi:hypothetical protein
MENKGTGRISQFSVPDSHKKRPTIGKGIPHFPADFGAVLCRENSKKIKGRAL